MNDRHDSLTDRGKLIHMRSENGTIARGALAAGLLLVDLTMLAITWAADDWQPLTLVVVLAVACALGELRPIEVRGVQTSTSGFLLVLPMVLLGPAPAATIGLLIAAIDTAQRRPAALDAISNVVSIPTTALAGALVFDALESGGGIDTPTKLAIAAFAIGLGTDFLGFGLLVVSKRLNYGRSVAAILRGTYGPIAAFHVVAATLVAAAAYAYVTVGLAALIAFLVVLRASDLLLRAVASADARATEVAALADERALFLTQSLVAEEAEREWLASHLHDEGLQLLAIAAQDLEEALDGDAAALERGRDHVLAAIAEMRRTLTHFHPMAMAADGLRPALETLTGQLCRRSEGIVDIPEGLNVHDPSLVYAVARELIGNAAKHADAQRIHVRLTRTDGYVVLTVADDGVGFVPEHVPEVGHVGLLLTEHRVSAAGGRLRMRSSPGEGTVAVATLPSP